MTKTIFAICLLIASCAGTKIVYRTPLDECRLVHCPAAAREQQERLLSTSYDEIDDDCVCELHSPGNLYVTKRGR